MINFYHCFIPGVARILQPLTTALAGNPKVLIWLPTMSAAFATAKATLVTTVPLAHPLSSNGRHCHPRESGPPATGRSKLAAARSIHQKTVQNRGKLLHVWRKTAHCIQVLNTSAPALRADPSSCRQTTNRCCSPSLGFCRRSPCASSVTWHSYQNTPAT
jgi:hypothetical protein